VLMYWLFHSFFVSLEAPPIAPRQAGLHWSKLYDVVACRDGHCMLAPTPAGGFPALLQWMAEDGVSSLPELDMSNSLAMFLSLGRFLPAMRAWASRKSARDVFLGGQQRRLCFGEVMSVADAAAMPQLPARGFFRKVDEASVVLPGPLFRMEATPAPPARAPEWLAYDAALARWADARRDGWSTAPTNRRPLEGIRVLDFTWVLAGPYAMRILADLGADVVKLQTEERSRAVNDNTFPYFVLWNRNKRSANLNLKHPRAAEIFLRLVEKSDVVVDNFSAGVLDRLGIGYEQARARNPRIIYLSMAGCGRSGPWRDFVTYAPTIQALCGLTYLTNPPGRRDVGYGFAVIDHMSGLAGALAVLEALASRQRTGKGQLIDLAQLEVGTYVVGPAFVDLLNNGREHHPAGNRDPFDDPVPNEVYRCPNDEWLAVTARDDGEWKRLCEAIGRPDLAADVALAAVAGRRAARAAVDSALAAWSANRDAESAMRLLQASGIAAGMVQNARDWFERDEQLAARCWLALVEHPVYGQLPVEVFPGAFSATPLDRYRASPLFGEHNFEVYPELLGMSEAEIAEAIADGLFT